MRQVTAVQEDYNQSTLPGACEPSFEPHSHSLGLTRYVEQKDDLVTRDRLGAEA